MKAESSMYNISKNLKLEETIYNIDLCLLLTKKVK